MDEIAGKYLAPMRQPESPDGRDEMDRLPVHFIPADDSLVPQGLYDLQVGSLAGGEQGGYDPEEQANGNRR